MTISLLSKSLPALANGSSFKSVSGPFDLVICDIWGVLHNGLSPFPAAHQALLSARNQGKTIILLSNAPRPNADVVRQLLAMGIPRDAYDGIVTSGDIARDQIATRSGQRVFLLGPERDMPIFDKLDVALSDLDTADYVLCTGLFDDEVETPDDYIPLLTKMLERRLLMLCANPDLVVERGPKQIYCAGAIAERYAQMGGEMMLIGKPFGIAYEYACNACERLRGMLPEKKRIIAIGDAIRTDIRGANQFGIPSLFITSGIHAAELHGPDSYPDAPKIADFLRQQAYQPDFIAPALVW